ncbi:MAG TPA: hypothetical protein VJ903_04585 [Clostridia bacterium]|nr:hypothetical protein [Clostridia bacterium]
MEKRKLLLNRILAIVMVILPFLLLSTIVIIMYYMEERNFRNDNSIFDASQDFNIVDQTIESIKIA